LIGNFVQFTGFSTLVTQGTDYPSITHIPMELEYDNQGNKVLRGHMAKANPHWKDIVGNPKGTICCLSDFNHYISSSWYDYPEAPTWNYISVHFSGPIRILDFDETVSSVRDLTKRYEKSVKGKLDFDTLPPNVTKQLRGITGIEMKVDRTEAVFKLSQNQSLENFDRIVDRLKETSNPRSLKLAETMVKLKNLFYQ